MTLQAWLILALVSPFFWGIVHVLDSYCVDKVFDAPWVGTVTSSLTMLAFLPLASIGLVVADSSSVTYLGTLECIVGGAFFMMSQVLYFKALGISESGIVAAYWNLLPLLLLVIGFFFLDEQFSVPKYLGSAFLILASVLFCLVDSNLEYRWYSFWFMFLGSCFQAVYFVLLDHAFRGMSVYPAFLIATVAMIAFGATPLVFKNRRVAFSKNFPKIWKASKFLLVIELANLIAVATSQYAIGYGPVSLVACVEATIPVYTFGISGVLYFVYHRFGEEEANHRLKTKIALAGLMVLGVWLVS